MLNRQEIRRLIEEKKLISGYPHLDTQLTPNGFDLTVGQVHAFTGAGALDFSNKQRVLAATRLLEPVKGHPGDEHGWWQLDCGAYKIVSNETVDLPTDMTAIAFPRSSLLRMGAFTQTGVWDAGFRGTSEFILLVQNPHGIRLKENSRVIQLVFIGINHTEQGYQGVYRQP